MLRKAHAFGGIFWNPVRCLGQGKARLLYALSETQRRIAEQMINAQKLRERRLSPHTSPAPPRPHRLAVHGSH